jgi:nitric oxide dioxygenase
MSVTGIAVANLDRLEDISPILHALGHRHAGYGVQPADYESVAAALTATLEQRFGAHFTRALRDAWSVCYWALADEMKPGASSLTSSDGR